MASEFWQQPCPNFGSSLAHAHLMTSIDLASQELAYLLGCADALLQQCWNLALSQAVVHTAVCRRLTESDAFTGILIY